MSPSDWQRVTLVLGGGGMKGLAHVGVLRALEEHGLTPQTVIGSSMGALIGAAWCAGTSPRDLWDMAGHVKRRDLFRVAHRNMALKRMRSPALYQRRPLYNVIRGLLGDVGFAELERPLLVNTVDLNSGQQVLWGGPGRDDVPVADAVYASCALPGYLPPQRIGTGDYSDGASIANLPIEAAAATNSDVVIAIDVGSTVPHRGDLSREGFAAVYARAIEVAVRRMSDLALRLWQRPPLILIQPRVARYSMFTFTHNVELMEEGYRATTNALRDPTKLPTPDAVGVFRFNGEPR